MTAPARYRLPLDEHALPVAPRQADMDREILRRNAVWFCHLRWVVVGLLLLTAALAWLDALRPLGIALRYDWPLVIAVVLGALNIVYVMLIPWEHARLAQVRLHLGVQIVADLAVLTAVVHYLGSVETPAAFMYLFHIILACVFFPPRHSLAVLALAAALLVGLFGLEGSGALAPATVAASGPMGERNLLSGPFWGLHLAPVLGIWGAIWYLASWLAGALRRREAELAINNARLKAGTEERARHMLQTTHQLKAPFAAIHANTQLLLGGSGGPLPEAARGLIERIAARSAMLSQQILDMLQLANLRSEGQVAAFYTTLDLAEIIQATIARVEPAARLRSIAISSEVEPVAVEGIEDHLRMLIDNLLNNAVNYSRDGGAVDVTCRGGPDRAVVTIRDQGIGIPADKLPHIFDEFYRTREAVRHNQASTGLGLSIVRDVARAAHIDVEVESLPDHGTCFTLTLPTKRPTRSRSSWLTF